MNTTESQLQFDPETHTYKRDGQKLPSVTTILGAVGIIDSDSPWYTEWHRERGTLTHLATALYDNGQLDDSSVDDELRGYLEAWMAFRMASRCAIVSTELRVDHPTMMYAGTVDRVVVWQGLKTVIDIKTGPKSPWHALQTSAYAACIPGVMARAAVYLQADGKFRADEHKSENDFQVFASALTLYNWKKGTKH